MMSESFIEDVLDTDNNTMIAREFNGMEAVARFDKDETDTNGGDE